MDGCGPFSRKLPQPTTVPVFPSNRVLAPEVGKHTGRIVLVNFTGLSRVNMAMSLYCKE